MTPDERAVAVRAISAMAEFAGMAGSPEGSVIVDREARLVDPANPDAVRAGLTRLLAQHKVEWDLFKESLPDGSWIGRVAKQL